MRARFVYSLLLVLSLCCASSAWAGDDSTSPFDFLTFSSDDTETTCQDRKDAPSTSSYSPETPVQECQRPIKLPFTDQLGAFTATSTLQTWEHSKVSSPQEFWTLAGRESRLVRSTGSVPLLPDQHLALSFDARYTSSINRVSTTRQPTGEGWAGDRLGFASDIKGQWKKTKYWAEYSFFGKDFTQRGTPTPQDRGGGKAGWQLDWGMLHPRIEFSRYATNVAQDPSLLRTLTSRGDVSLRIQPPKWLDLTLRYQRHQQTIGLPGSLPQRDMLGDTFSGRLSYQGSKWQVYGQSQLTTQHDTLRAHSTSTTRTHIMGGFYTPMKKLTLRPRVQLSRVFSPEHLLTQEIWLAELRTQFQPLEHLTIQPFVQMLRIMNHTQANLTDILTNRLIASYKGFDGALDINLSGAVKTQYDSLGTVGQHTFDFSLRFEHNLKRVLGLPYQQQSFGLYLTRSEHVDMYHPDQNILDFSGLIMFKLQP